MKAMKPNRIVAAIASVLLLAACSDRPDRLFSDFFVCVQDENGSERSRVLSTSGGLVVTYYFQLVSEVLDETLTVDFDIIVGDGLTEGVDYVLQRDIRSIDFEPGVFKKPFRINYLSHAVDPSKDNTITIRLKSTSSSSVRVGYPGPNAKFSQHVIEKYNL